MYNNMHSSINFKKILLYNPKYHRYKMKNSKCKYYCYNNTREKNDIKTHTLKAVEMVIFDMDGVLTDTYSSWKYVHDYFKTSNDKSVDQYLKGIINDEEFIKRDAELWIENGKPIKIDKLEQILSEIPIMNGAKRCIDKLKEKNIKTAIVSAGLDVLARRVQEYLGIDYSYSNGIKIDRNGFLTGEGIIGVRLMYKDKTIEKISNEIDIPYKNIVSVGNSCFDIPMFEVSGLGIAFNPDDDCVKNAADIIIENKDLSEILLHLNNYI